jgi:hypothetical protein
MATVGTAHTETVLLSYSTNVLQFAVSGGVWTSQGDFANKTNSYGGKSFTFGGLTSDGRRVFIGESATTTSRILEFDVNGVYQRTLATVGQSVEEMAVSPDGQWLYATVGSSFSAATTNAAVYRYNPVTGAGGLFIANAGTNAAGTITWKWQIPRGVTVDGEGHVWVSERTTGYAYAFDTNGVCLAAISGLTGIQALCYSASNDTIYASSNSDASYVINPRTATSVTRTIGGINNRVGITLVGGTAYSAPYFMNAIVRCDFAALIRTSVVACPLNAGAIATVPSSPLRATSWQMLVSETGSNRVTRLTVDSMGVVDRAGVFAGEGTTYDGTALRSPRGLASFSNTVYIAEGVPGGRILRFSAWGTYKGVQADFSQTDSSNCVPTALAVSPDGNTLYVTDARTLYLRANEAMWANVPTNGYYATNGFGEVVYKINRASKAISVFADASSCVAGSTLLECHGVAADDNGRVYCTTWFNKTNALYQTLGTLYQFGADGTRQATYTLGNATICYFDPSGAYAPATANTSISGAGVLFSGNGMQDLWWAAAGGGLNPVLKLLDMGSWRNYMDAEVIDGRLWFTDPEFGTLWRRSGDASRESILTGLGTPTYLTRVQVTGTEPPPPGTIVTVW